MAFAQNILVLLGTGFRIHSKRKIVNLYQQTEQSMFASTAPADLTKMSNEMRFNFRAVNFSA